MANWKDTNHGYGVSGQSMFLGKWNVASIGWDGVNKTEEKWIVYCHLPGLKSKLTKQYKSIEDAKKKAEEVVEFWLSKAEIGK